MLAKNKRDSRFHLIYILYCFWYQHPHILDSFKATTNTWISHYNRVWSWRCSLFFALRVVVIPWGIISSSPGFCNRFIFCNFTLFSSCLIIGISIPRLWICFFSVFLLFFNRWLKSHEFFFLLFYPEQAGENRVISRTQLSILVYVNWNPVTFDITW